MGCTPSPNSNAAAVWRGVAHQARDIPTRLARSVSKRTSSDAEARRLGQLDEENRKLKQLLAEATLDNHVLRVLLRKNG